MIKQLIINKDLENHKKGDIVAIECDNGGTPLDHAWRRRLKDSVLDGCVEWKKESKSMKHVKIEDKSIKGNK